jgi:digalactosyldiacylglycerol synthase
MTGTSINPLLRAAYLAKDRPPGKIHLLVPWLKREDQEISYPPGIRFDHPDQQREYVQKWLIEDAHLPEAANKLNISFFSGRFEPFPPPCSSLFHLTNKFIYLFINK